MRAARSILWFLGYTLIGALLFGALGLTGLEPTLEYPRNLSWLAGLAVIATYAGTGWIAWRLLTRLPGRSKGAIPAAGLARVFTVEATSYAEAMSLAQAKARSAGFANPRVDNYGPAEGLPDDKPWADGVLRRVQVAVAEDSDA